MARRTIKVCSACGGQNVKQFFWVFDTQKITRGRTTSSCRRHKIKIQEQIFSLNFRPPFILKKHVKKIFHKKIFAPQNFIFNFKKILSSPGFAWGKIIQHLRLMFFFVCHPLSPTCKNKILLFAM